MGSKGRAGRLTLWVDRQAKVRVLGHVARAGGRVVGRVGGGDEVRVRHVRQGQVVGGRESWRVAGRVTFGVRCDHHAPHPRVVL